MNVLQEPKENQTAAIVIDVTPVDYIEQVEKELKKFGKQATIKGFRQGAIPKSEIQKRFGKSILFDELNKLVSKKLEEHLTENNVQILGNPLPVPMHDFEVNWSNPINYTFTFEVGLAPEVNLTLPPSQAIPYYQIISDEAKVDQYIDDIRIRQGKFTNPEKSEEDSILYGEFEELDANGEILKDGIKTKTTLAVNMVKDADEKAKFIGIDKNAVVIFNPAKAFQNNVEIGAMFNLKTDVAAELKSDFRLTLETINKKDIADLDQDLFDKVYGPGNVNSEAEFREKVKVDIERMFTNESERKLKHDTEDVLLDECKMTLPEEFLKRWLKAVSEKPLTTEQIETEFPSYGRGLKLRLIENKIFRDQQMQIADEEVKAMAKDILYQQFAQYGMMQGLEDAMDGMVDRYLQKRENVDRVYENLSEFKTFSYLKSIVNRDVKTVSYEEFQKIVSEHHH